MNMKTHIRSLIYCLAAAVLGIALPACENTDYLKYNSSQKDQIYFQSDSVNFVYGFRSDEDADLEVRADVIGFVNTQGDTPFSVSVNRELTTAVEGTHFKVLPGPTIDRDSTHGAVKIDFTKSNLELGKQYMLTLDLVENDSYKPAEVRQCRVYFGNLEIPAPKWWRDEYVGTYTQEKFVLFVELYSETKETSPYFYNTINNLWGPTLQGTPSREAFLLTTAAYRGYLIRYIYGPMYEYYLSTNDPKYEIPNPANL